MDYVLASFQDYIIGDFQVSFDYKLIKRMTVTREQHLDFRLEPVFVLILLFLTGISLIVHLFICIRLITVHEKYTTFDNSLVGDDLVNRNLLDDVFLVDLDLKGCSFLVGGDLFCFFREESKALWDLFLLDV